MTISSLPDDAVTQNGTLLFTYEAVIQCVAVSVSSVSAGSTNKSCLTLTLSPTTTVSGLTLSPSVATVCKVPAEGELVYYVSIIISNSHRYVCSADNSYESSILKCSVFLTVDGTSVTVDIEQGFYSARESAGPMQVCVGASAGNISGRNISIYYMTIDGSAQGMLTSLLIYG